MTGIAHVSFPGGGIFLPARNPYDRQMLVEHVTDRVRTKGQVQVLVDQQRWMVHLSRGPVVMCCASCGSAAESACYSPSHGDAAFCLTCAFGGEAEPARSHHEQVRRVG